MRSYTVEFLERFLQDREVGLFDGMKSVDTNKLKALETTEKSWIPIHPALRVIALAYCYDQQYLEMYR